MGESDERPFRPADVAEPIRVLIPDCLAYELGSALTASRASAPVYPLVALRAAFRG